MNSKEHTIIKLASFLQMDVPIHRWKESVDLPLFIQSLYAIYETTILDTECLILEEIGRASCRERV